MGYYRNYRRQSYAPIERVTGNNIAERLTALANNPEVPQNTKDFLQSLLAACEKYEGLTGKQYEAFEKVEARFSAEKIAERKAWASEYTAPHRAIAKICANYYLANPPYFQDLARHITNDDDFIPTEKQYRALCDNKYAKKVVASTRQKEKFVKGSMVMGRATAPRAIRNKHLVVIEVNAAPVKSAAKGSKIYRVLPVGSPNTLLVEEREIKRAPKTKKKK